MPIVMHIIITISSTTKISISLMRSVNTFIINSIRNYIILPELPFSLLSYIFPFLLCLKT